MDPVKLLKDDHEKARKLFKEFQGTGERAFQTRKNIGDTILMELEVHSKIEEEIFYPALRQKGSEEIKDTVAEGFEEHAIVDQLIEELKMLDPQDETYMPKFTVLIENVLHHMEEEENEMLPGAKKSLGDQFESIGDKMMQRKQQLMQQLQRKAA